MKRLRFASFMVGITLLGATSALATTPHFTAKVYDPKDHTKLMFNYKSDFEVNGDTKTYTNSMTDLNGEVLAVETTVLKDGNLVSFEQDQRQLKSDGRVEIKGEKEERKAFFNFKRDDKTKTDDEKAGPDFIVTSTLVPYLQAHWAELMKGETVKARLAVLDRQETVGFQFTKESEKKIRFEKNGVIGDESVLVIKMRASSAIIAAMVDPLFFTFTPDGMKLIELEGRTSVKIMKDGKYRDFDGYTVYSYPEAK